MFLFAELETEARKTDTRLTTWRFHLDDDGEKFINEVIENAQSSLYNHKQSTDCPDIGMCFNYCKLNNVCLLYILSKYIIACTLNKIQRV